MGDEGKAAGRVPLAALPYRPNVRFGSKTDIPQCPSNVRFTPINGQVETTSDQQRSRNNKILVAQGFLARVLFLSGITSGHEQTNTCCPGVAPAKGEGEIKWQN
jgi:hypothetical protein